MGQPSEENFMVQDEPEVLTAPAEVVTDDESSIQKQDDESVHATEEETTDLGNMFSTVEDVDNSPLTEEEIKEIKASFPDQYANEFSECAAFMNSYRDEHKEDTISDNDLVREFMYRKHEEHINKNPGIIRFRLKQEREASKEQDEVFE
jgi:hypothetical protein